MELKPGYKQTEVGVIPEDWDAKPLGSQIDLLTGFPFPSSGYAKSGIRLLRCSNIKRGKTDWSDEITQYWSAVTQDLSSYSMQKGDLVIAMDGSLVGRSYAQLEESDLPALLLQRVARIRSTKLDVTYLRLLVGSDHFISYVDSVKTVTAIPHISPSDIRKFTVPVPPTVTEQKAIAQALSDTDTLISGLDDLIAKKRDIKQATMQQLLTGKTRLPGFSGEWEVKRLGDVGFTYGGLTGKSKSDFGSGSGEYITFMNVMKNTVIDCLAFEKVHLSEHEMQSRVRRGDLIFNGSSETPEEVGLCAVVLDDVKSVYLNSFCFGFRCHNTDVIDGSFIARFFRSDAGRDLVKSLAQGSTRYNLSKVALLNTRIPFPPLTEQKAIATVLTDIDDELAALEQRREKTRELKQAMMQELLTGRTRLV